jgi:hypothetical protein
MSQYVYTIKCDVVAILVGGTLNISFWPYEQVSGLPSTVFYGGFGGLAAGAANTWGTAWLNYDVDWLKREGWTARFEANFAAVATNVNLWGNPGGEVIGNTAAGGVGVLLGIVGGQGHFGDPTT